MSFKMSIVSKVWWLMFIIMPLAACDNSEDDLDQISSKATDFRISDDASESDDWNICHDKDFLQQNELDVQQCLLELGGLHFTHDDFMNVFHQISSNLCGDLDYLDMYSITQKDCLVDMVGLTEICYGDKKIVMDGSEYTAATQFLQECLLTEHERIVSEKE